MKRRILKRCEALGIEDVPGMLDGIGMTPKSLNNWTLVNSDGPGPGVFLLYRIAKRLSWSVEEMLFDDRPDAATDGIESVPVLDLRAAAGGGFVPVEEAREVRIWKMPGDDLRRLDVLPENARIVAVIGDSMVPTMAPNDLMVIDISYRKIREPGLYVLWDGDGVVAKRVERVIRSDPAMLRVISDNPKHPPYEVPEQGTDVFGRIAGILKVT